MLIDGKKIREEIKEEIKKEVENLGPLVLAVVWVGDDPVTAKFIEQKRRFAEDVGIELRLFEYEAGIGQEDLEKEIERLSADDSITGIIVQLPLPSHLDAFAVLAKIIPKKDVDALTKEPLVLSPVVAAVKEIFTRFDLSQDKKILVVGRGRLVGRPIAVWLTQEGFSVESIGEEVSDISRYTVSADIIISGVGVPEIIKPEMIKDGAVLIDIGTSESKGSVKGDIDRACEVKASLFSAVPGGVGPLTVAMIFKNLIFLRVLK